jgi:hypothetical protein
MSAWVSRGDAPRIVDEMILFLVYSWYIFIVRRLVLF